MTLVSILLPMPKLFCDYILTTNILRWRFLHLHFNSVLNCARQKICPLSQVICIKAVDFHFLKQTPFLWRLCKDWWLSYQMLSPKQRNGHYTFKQLKTITSWPQIQKFFKRRGGGFNVLEKFLVYSRYKHDNHTNICYIYVSISFITFFLSNEYPLSLFLI